MTLGEIPNANIFYIPELLAKCIKARGFNCLNRKKRKTLLKNDKIEVSKHSKNI